MQLFGNKAFCTVQTKPTPSPPQQGSKTALLSALGDTASLQPSAPWEQACGNIYSSLRGPYIPPALDRSKCPEEKAWREAVKGVKNRMGGFSMPVAQKEHQLGTSTWAAERRGAACQPSGCHPLLLPSTARGASVSGLQTPHRAPTAHLLQGMTAAWPKCPVRSSWPPFC